MDIVQDTASSKKYMIKNNQDNGIAERKITLHTCFPKFPVPEDGHDHQEVPQNIHHDGRDEDARQQGHDPGERLLPPAALLSARRGVPRAHRPLHHHRLIVLQRQGHQLRQVPRVDDALHRAAESASIQRMPDEMHRVGSSTA